MRHLTCGLRVTRAAEIEIDAFEQALLDALAAITDHDVKWGLHNGNES
jgi:hypothetical protein